jgi:hypothetical protein
VERNVALEILKAWPLDESAVLTADQEAALRLLEEDPELDRAFRQLDPLDERISWSMSDVAVDEDARQRLLHLLPAERVAVVGKSSGDEAIPRRSALRRAVGMTVASTLMLAIASWTIWNSAGSGLTLATVRQSVPELWQGELTEFDGNFEPSLPSGGWQSSRVRFDSTVRGFSLGATDRQQIAVRRFQVEMSGGRTTEGLLLVLEGSALSPADRPQPGDYVSAGAPQYVSVADGTQLAVVSWTEGERVYLCVLPAGPSEDALKRALHIAVS